jgi:predicted GNAT family acetyltransferase
VQQVTRNDDAGRYELRVDDRLIGIAEFHADGDRLVFPHTVIERSRRGEGFGAVLVRAALDDVRSRSAGTKVVPSCWYVRDFIRDNPEYGDLVA